LIGSIPSADPLSARGVGVRYGGVAALDAVDLRVTAGAIVGLIGPNGAGKTTFIDALTGYVDCKGSVELFGQDLRGLAPHVRARRGLARTFQAAELFDDMSVLDNIVLGSQRGSLRGVTRELLCGRRGDLAFVHELIDTFGLGTVADQEARRVPPGVRKLVALSRALASQPKVLLLDEPGAGLDSRESRALGEQLARIPALGVSVLLIDHDMDLVFGACSEVYVLSFGRVVFSGSPETVRSHESVISAYLGRGADPAPSEAESEVMQ
jgi:branched-chain amino acid transport system ATP-binding protein